MKDGRKWDCKFLDMPEFLDDIYEILLALLEYIIMKWWLKITFYKLLFNLINRYDNSILDANPIILLIKPKWMTSFFSKAYIDQKTYGNSYIFYNVSKLHIIYFEYSKS